MKKLIIDLSKYTLKKKMDLFFGLVVVLSFVLIWICVFTISWNTAYDRVEYSAHKGVEQAASFLENHADRMVKCANVVCMDDGIRGIFDKYTKKDILTNPQRVYSQHFDYIYLINYFKKIETEYELEVSCYINGDFDYSREGETVFRIEDATLMEEFKNKNFSTSFFTGTVSSEGKECITYIKPVKSTENFSRAVGYIRIDSPAVSFSDVLKNTNLYNNSITYITDSSEEILLLAQGDKIIFNNLESAKREIKNTGGFKFQKNVPGTDWGVVTLVPHNAVFSVASAVLIPFTLLLVLLLIIVYITIYKFSLRLTSRINHLINFIKNIDSIEGVTVPNTNPDDDVGILITAYNDMHKRIGTLLNQQLEDRVRFNMKILQEQVNPHFLYNCLTSISCLVRVGRKDEVLTSIKLLADFYRHNLAETDIFVEFESEMETVNLYFEIQKICSMEKMTLNVDVDLDLYEYKILKMTIQPIVENSIIHGLLPAKCKGEKNILITGYKEAGYAYLQITDNGIGISEEKLLRLFEDFPSQKHGIGLKNVNERLKLTYGEECGLSAESIEGEYTTITVKYKLAERNKGDNYD